MEVIDWVRADFRLPLAESAASAFTEEDIDYLDTLLPKKSVDALARRSGVAHEAEEPVRREQAAFRERKRRPGAFGAFFAALAQTGYDGPVIIEPYLRLIKSEEALLASIRSMRALLEQSEKRGGERT